MRGVQLVWGLTSLYALNACSPVFNWRDVRPEQTALKVLFPCKPEKEVRVLNLGGQTVSMTMMFCEAGGSTFTLAYADTKDTTGLVATLGQWRQATLANVRAQVAEELRFKIDGSNPSTPPVKVTAHGLRLDGTALTLQAAWFAIGSQVFQLAVSSDTLNASAADTFFAGITPQ